MSTWDLATRNSQTKKDYYNWYIQNIKNYSVSDRLILQYAVYKADNLLKPFKRISSIGWKFAKVSRAVENGYPHTFHDVIVFNDNILYDSSYKTIINLLIHEKVHIFQRLYPQETHLLFSRLGYEPYGPLPENVRNNPDSDNTCYKVNNVPVAIVYNDAPLGIHDVRTVNVLDGSTLGACDIGLTQDILQYDHPNEIMAYLICNKLTKNIKNTVLDEWAEQYF
jgi:hypothetical protein